MLGYVLTYGKIINSTLKNYEIKSFDVLSDDLEKNIYIVENNEILYDSSDLIKSACEYGHINVLKWAFKSKYIFKEIEKNNLNNLKKGIILFYNVYTVSREAFYAPYNKIKLLKFLNKLNVNFKNLKRLRINWHIRRDNIKFIKYLYNNRYKINYSNNAFGGLTNIKTIKFLTTKINIKKIIKWLILFKHKKILKFKTKNNYLKGYNKK